jgi:hypothetical protein
VNFNHQGQTLFGTLFSYDASGAPMWLVMSGGTLQGASSYSGDLYRTTGPAFNASPFKPITSANLTRVGSMTVDFSAGNSAVLTYSVEGVVVTKAITAQVFGSRAAACKPSLGDRSSLANYQDLWWNADESGWGINVTHQDDTIFATLFTYDTNGQDLWLVASAVVRQGDGSYQGDLFRTTGSRFNAAPFLPISGANITRVGTLKLEFSDGNHGRLTYSVNGVAVSKAITRQVFASPVPACA